MTNDTASDQPIPGGDSAPEPVVPSGADEEPTRPEPPNATTPTFTVARWVGIAALAGALAVGLGLGFGISAGVSATPTATPTPTPTPIVANGTMTVPRDYYSSSSSCAADDGYSDISLGAQVTITDESGKIVGIGHLGSGYASGAHCIFPFLVNEIPPGSKFYGIHIGNTNRGVVQQTADSLARIDLSIGK